MTKQVLLLVAVLLVNFSMMELKPQTYFYGTANMNAPMTLNNFGIDNTSSILPLFWSKFGKNGTLLLKNSTKVGKDADYEDDRK